MTSYISKYLIIALSIVTIIGTFSVQPTKAEPIPLTANPNYFYNRETAFIINFAFDSVNGGIYLAVRPDGQAFPALTMSGDIWGVPSATFGLANRIQGTDKSLYGHATCIRYFITEYQRVTYLESIGEAGLANLNAALVSLGATPLASPEALLNFATSCADFVIDNMVIDRVDDLVAENPWGGAAPVSPDIGDVTIPNRVFYWSSTSLDATERFVDDTLTQIAQSSTAPRVESIVPWSMVELSTVLQAAGVGNPARYRGHAIEWWDWRTTIADTLPAFNDPTPPAPDLANACPVPAGAGQFNDCIAGGGRDLFYPTLGYILGGAYQTAAIAEANSILGTGTAPNLPFPRAEALEDGTYVAGYARGVMFANNERAMDTVASRDQWWDFGHNPARLIPNYSDPGATAPFNNIGTPFTHYQGRELIAGTQRAIWFYYTYGENPNQAFPATGTFDDSLEMLQGVLGLWNYANEELWDTVDGQEAWYESTAHQYKPCFSAGTDLPIGDWAGPTIGNKIHTLNADNSAIVNVTDVSDAGFAYLSWEFRGSGVSSVDVVYSVDNGTSWNVIAAAPTAGNDYQATIPSQPDGTRVYYYARAQDAFRNNTAFPSGSEIWNDSGVSVSQNIGASQTYVIEPAVVATQTGVATQTEVATQAGVATQVGVATATLDVSDSSTSNVVVEASGLTISKSVFPPIASAGDTVDWTITVSNPSNADFPGFSVTDTISDELTIVSTATTLGTVSINAQNVTLLLDSLSAGQTATLTITTRIRDDVAGAIVTNSVRDVSASLIIVNALPNTGETPWWHPCHLIGVCR